LPLWNIVLPANRMGSAVYSPAELKTIQQVNTLVVFARPHRGLFQSAAQPDSMRGFALIALGALLVFRGQA
jgi:uncharacterized protein (DUF486 family)